MVSEFVVRFAAHGPVEFGLEVGLEDFLDWHILELAPADGDTGVHVVDSRRSERYRAVIFTGL